MRHAEPARAGPSATLESMIAGSLIREDAARGALPLSRMGDGCRRAEIELQRSGLLAEGRFHDGPARERHVPAKMLGTYFAYLRGRACVWKEGSYDV